MISARKLFPVPESRNTVEKRMCKLEAKRTGETSNIFYIEVFSRRENGREPKWKSRDVSAGATATTEVAPKF